MDNNLHELSDEQLNDAVGGGLVDSLLSETEAAADTLVKRIAEDSKKFSAFLNPVVPEAPPSPIVS
jgi:hypothetical protein